MAQSRIGQGKTGEIHGCGRYRALEDGLAEAAGDIWSVPGPASTKTVAGAATQQLLLDGQGTGGEPPELDFELRWRAKSGVIRRSNWWDYF